MTAVTLAAAASVALLAGTAVYAAGSAAVPVGLDALRPPPAAVVMCPPRAFFSAIMGRIRGGCTADTCPAPGIAEVVK